MERSFSGVAKRRVPDVVGETGCLDEIRVDEIVRAKQVGGAIEPIADAATNLCHFDGVGQASAVEIILATEENLRLVLEPTECRRVNDPIPIDLKRRAIIVRISREISLDPFAIKLGVKLVFHYRLFCRSARIGRLRNARNLARVRFEKGVENHGLFLFSFPRSCEQIGRLETLDESHSAETPGPELRIPEAPFSDQCPGALCSLFPLASSHCHDVVFYYFWIISILIMKGDFKVEAVRENRGLGFHWMNGIVTRYEMQQAGKTTHPTEDYVIRIGDIAIYTNPYELFTDFGVRIQARSPAVQTFVVQLAGQYGKGVIGGYAPTERAVEGGSYGATIKSNRVVHEGGQQMVDATVAELAWLFKEAP